MTIYALHLTALEQHYAAFFPTRAEQNLLLCWETCYWLEAWARAPCPP